MSQPKTKTMRPKAGKHGKKGKVHGIHIKPMNGPKGPGFHVSVDRERDPESMMMGRQEPEEQFHPNLKSAFNHANEAFGPPDAGEPQNGEEPDADDVKPAAQDTTKE